MSSSGRFTSVFRINGFPILPPLITEELHEEIQIYKLKAKEIELKISARNEKYKEHLQEKEETDLYVADFESSQSSESEDEEEVVEQDNQDPPVDLTQSTNYSEVPYEKLDNTCTTALESSIDLPDLDVKKSEESVEIEEKIDSLTITEESDKNTIHENLVDTLTDIDVDVLVPDNSDKKDSEPSSDKHEYQRRSTSLSLQEETLTQRETSPSPLVRSNSYTLDNPSPLLLKRMAAEGIFFGDLGESKGSNKNLFPSKSPSKTSKGPKILAPKLKKSPYDIKLSMPSKKKKNLANYKCKKVISPEHRQKIALELKESVNSGCCTNSHPKKDPKVVSGNEKSPRYKFMGSKSSCELIGKQESRKMFSDAEESRKFPESVSSENFNGTSNDGIEKIIEIFRKPSSKLSVKDSEATLVEAGGGGGAGDSKMILSSQEQCNLKMQALIKQQEQEIQKMQDKFKKQQEELLKMFCANQIGDTCDLPEMHFGNRTSTPLNVENCQPHSSDFSNLSSSQTLYLSNTITTDADDEDNGEFFTCVNKDELELDFQSPKKYNNKISIDSYMDHIKNNYQLKSGNIQHEIIKLQTKAATKITACARGYLTRRLFKTLLVQSHIQTIRDTLLLILDLAHEERMTGIKKSSEEDVLLKLRVLKQLQESCNRIHEIFFVIPVKERMEMICRDRERLEKKRMERSLNLSRNASFTSQKSLSSQRSAQRPVNKLQFCSLFSVDIQGEPVIEPESESQETQTDQIQTQIAQIPKEPTRTEHYSRERTPISRVQTRQSPIQSRHNQSEKIPLGTADSGRPKERTHVTNIILSPNFPKKGLVQHRPRSVGHASNENKSQVKPWR